MPVERFEDRLRHTVHRLRTGDNWTGMSQTQIVSGQRYVMLDLDRAERFADLVAAAREHDHCAEMGGCAICDMLSALDEAGRG